MAAESSSLSDVTRKLNGTAEAALEVQIPQGGEHYYYSNFPAYKEQLKEGLATIQQLMSTCESMIRNRRAPPPDWMDADEVAAWSSELLDDVVEKIDGALDAERARARGREAGPRRPEAAGSVAAGITDDAALLVNLPSFGGSPLRPSRGRDALVRHAVGLPRPQESFDPPPDNRVDVPFRPRVDHLRGLMAETCDPRVYQAAPGAPEDYPHPLASNLAELTYRPDQLQPPPQPLRPPAAPEDSPLVWVDGEGPLAGMVSELEVAEELAVDLEHHSHRSFQGFTCLMQISTRTTDYVVDTLALRNQLGPALARVFADPRVVKVLHGADSDVEWLQRDFGLFPVNMFDTGQAARVLGLPSFGLAYLLESICGVQADKRFQMADWRVRPLSPQMLHYARCDTHYLLYVYDKLREQLAALPDQRILPSVATSIPANSPGGALGLVLERSRQLCLKTYRKPLFTPDGYQELLRRWQLNLNPQQTSVFAALLAWRDRVCRVEDESTGYVLSKAQLVALAQAMPEDLKRVQSVLGRAISEVATRRLGELVAAINDAKHRPIEMPPFGGGGGSGSGVGVAVAAPAATSAGGTAAALPVLKPRAVAPIRTVMKAAGAAAGPLAAAKAPVAGVSAGEPAGASAEGSSQAPAKETPMAPAVDAAMEDGGDAAFQQGLSSRKEAKDGVAATARPIGGESLSGMSVQNVPEAKAGGAAANAPAAAEGGAGPTTSGVLKPRALKPPPLKSAAVSRSAALFGGVATSAPSAAELPPSATASSARSKQSGLPSGPPCDPQPDEKDNSRDGGGGGAGPSPSQPAPAGAVTSAAAPVPLQPTRPAVAAIRRVQLGGGGAASASLLGAIFGESSGSGSMVALMAQHPAAHQPAATVVTAGGSDNTDEEERLAQQRAKRLRATFTLPFAAAAAARQSSVAAAGGARESEAATAASASAADGAVAGGKASEGAPQASRAKPSATAADIRAAVEAMRAEGEDVEIAIGAGVQGGALVQRDDGGGPATGAAAARVAGGWEAPAARTIADTDRDDEVANGDDGQASGGGGGVQRRVAGSELGLDVLDYVPVPLSQMARKKKEDKARKRRVQSNCNAEEGVTGGDGGDRAHVAAPKRRRFTTEVPTGDGGNGGSEVPYAGESSSDGGDGTDSDGGHTVGPFAKKRPHKEHKQQQQSRLGETKIAAAVALSGRSGRGGKPAPKGLMADFPRSNIVPPAMEAAGRGGGRGARGGGRGGRGRGGGRQPTAFNPYDIPDEFLLKGGKRSAVMPRSGNRSFTFK